MALTFSVAVRNARLEAVETVISAGGVPTLAIWSGTPPANADAADCGDGAKLVEIPMPANWAEDAAAGSKAILAAGWDAADADVAGTATHFRIYENGGACRAQGTVGLPESGVDLILSNTNIAVDQPVDITTFTLTQAGA